MKKSVYSGLIILVITIVILVISLTSCGGYKGYSGDNSELYTVAINSVPWINGFSWTADFVCDPQIEIVEEDEYGRIMFIYHERYYGGSDIGFAALVISQSSNEKEVFYYEDVNYIVKKQETYIAEVELEVFNEEEIEALKSINDWDQEIDYDKCIKKEITNVKAAIPYEEEIKQQIIDEFDLPKGEYMLIMDVLTSNTDNSKLIVYGHEKINDDISFIGLVEHEEGVFKDLKILVPENVYDYQAEFIEFKSNNGWYADQESNKTDNSSEENNSTDNTATEEKPSKETVAKALADALESKIKVYETHTNKMNYLKDCLTPYQGIPLAAFENLSYTRIDMDGDSYDELVIDCGDTMLLRYFEGKVYLYRFSFRALYNLTSDGSYSWSNGGALNYGENRIYFEGTELKTKEVWSIVKDGEPDAEYYIEGKQVTGEEILKYFEDNPKTKVEFLPLEVSWQNNISYSEGLALAEKYWEDLDIEENHYVVSYSHYQDTPETVYVFTISWRIDNHYSIFDEIWIDVNTGETIIPSENAKG